MRVLAAYLAVSFIWGIAAVRSVSRRDAQMLASPQATSMVRVKPSVLQPVFGWQGVTHKSLGVVYHINHNNLAFVDFPELIGFRGYVHELEVVQTPHHLALEGDNSCDIGATPATADSCTSAAGWLLAAWGRTSGSALSVVSHPNAPPGCSLEQVGTGWNPVYNQDMSGQNNGNFQLICSGPKKVDPTSWSLSGNHQSCATHCSQNGKVCDADEQSKVTRPISLVAISAEINFHCDGYSSSAQGGPSVFGYAPSPWFCSYLLPGTSSDCNQASSSNQQQLCFCRALPQVPVVTAIVKVKPTIAQPLFGWQGVSHESFGVAYFVNHNNLFTVDFPELLGWRGFDYEVEVVQAEYHLAPQGANACDIGSTPTAASCAAAARWLLAAWGRTAGAALSVGAKPQAPPGCSLEEDGATWNVVHNTNMNGVNNGNFQLVCSGPKKLAPSSWSLSGNHESCTTHCGHTGQVCDADEQNKVTRPISLVAISAEINFQCGGYPSSAQGGPSVFGYTGSGFYCSYLAAGTSSDCNQASSANQQQLCSCRTP